MSERDLNDDAIDITQSEGPGIEVGDDLQTRLGTPEAPGAPTPPDGHPQPPAPPSEDPAKAHEYDQVHSVQATGEDR